MPRRFVISWIKATERMGQRRTQESKAHMVPWHYKPNNRLMRFCLRSHYHLHHHQKECQEKGSTSYVSGRPKPMRHKMWTSGVRSYLHHSSVSTSNGIYQQNMSTRKDKGSELKICEGILAVSAFLSLAGPMQARRPSSSESVTQQSSPKFSIPGALRFVLYKYYAID